LFSKRFSRETKHDYFTVSKDFFNKYVSNDEINQLNAEFQYIVLFCKKYDFEDLEYLNQNMKKITSHDVSFCNQDGIFAKQEHFTKNHSFSEVINVKSLAKDIIRINKIELNSSCFIFEGLFTQDLLINSITQYTLIFRRRDNNAEKRYNDYIVPKENYFHFEINLKSLLLSQELSAGIWDLFIEASAEDYRFERRVGNQRDFQPQFSKSKWNGLDGHSYSIEPYFTNPYDNLSFKIEGNK